jgi:prepilin-type processing-associated H-X9-DG protein
MNHKPTIDEDPVPNKPVKRSETWIRNAMGFGIPVVIICRILFPVFAKVREMARSTSCISDMKQIGMGLIQYTQDNDGYPPPIDPDNWSHTWRNTISPYLKDPRIYKCPTRANSRIGLDGLPNDYSVVYTKNGFFVPIGSTRVTNASIDDGGSLIILCESNDYGPSINIDANPQAFEQRLWVGHTKGSNYAFLDGHVKWLRPQQTYSYNDHDTLQKTINFWYRDGSKPLSTVGMYRVNSEAVLN